MTEHPEGNLTRGARHDPGEHHLAQFGEQGDADACSAVGQKQADRQHHEAGFYIETVDDMLEDDRYQQVEQLGREHQA
ncbi:hypothetical protein D9M71_436130 [compost metagenome]